MASPSFTWHSIKAQVTLTTLAIFATSACLLALYGDRMLRRDLQRLLGEQQFAAVTFLAQGVHGEFEHRAQALAVVAKELAPVLAGPRPIVQERLARLSVFQLQFNAGTWITGQDGAVIAAWPLGRPGAGDPYGGRELLASVLRDGQPMLGQLVQGGASVRPKLVMAVPVRDAKGQVIGALAGITDLGQPNFLDQVIENPRLRATGQFLIAPQNRMIVCSSDRARVMEVLPPPGVSPWIDRFMQGFEGTAVVVNPHGVKVLVSVKQILPLGWYATVILPTSEAFAPVRALQRNMLVATVMLALLAGGLIWWTLRRQLAPMVATLKTLAGLSDPGQPPQSLPVASNNEIGALIRGFNGLLATLKQREEALKASERRSLAIIEASPVPLAMNDEQGRVTFVNKAFVQALGYTVAEIPTLEDWRRLAYPDPEYRAWVASTWVSRTAEARLTGKPFVPIELNIRCQDQSVRTFMSSAATLEDTVDRVHLVILYDLTDRKRLEGQLHQSQKMESLGLLAGGVAHDMNNVLGAILGLASVHTELQAPGSAVHAAFTTITQACNRGGSLIRSLLGFARQGLAEERDLDMNALVREEVRLLERTTLARVRLEMDLAPQLRPMRGDASALAHMLMNLCVNAVDAMPEQATLVFRTRNLEPDGIEVQVEDSGVGMSKEVLERALDPFFTTKEQGKGTGLGLAIAHATVMAHHGQMEIQSQPGQGTKVTVRFPASGTSLEAPLLEETPALEESHRAGLQVLLVDDDELIQSTLRTILEVLGHTVATAPCGEDALLLLEAGHDPDVVILDMNMPGLGGSGTLPRLRILRPALPVLLATGRPDQAALDLLQAYPQVTLLAKPFGMKALQMFLETLG